MDKRGSYFSYESEGSATAVAEQPLPYSADKKKPVLVTGAGGLVGIHTCRELSRNGWQVRALIRDPARAAMTLGQLPVEFRVGDARDATTLRGSLSGCGAVVHLAAIAIERKGQTYRESNTAMTERLISAARAENVQRVVFMSQNGADSSSPYAFLRSKGVAQDSVKTSGLAWTILRPSVIFGPEDQFVNVLARLIRLTPKIFPLPGGGKSRFQPIAVDDVARVVRLSLEKKETVHQIYGLGGAVPLTLRQMTERILTAMGTTRRLVSIPIGILRPLVALAQKIIPNPPVTPGLLDLLAVDNTVANNALTEQFKIVPVPFAGDELQYLRRITARSALKSLFERG
ncbi:MAG TPA: complex I NDUFA9 subunit family protein [Gemmatimonadaceae bacterium]|jgi:NADH dehydrogenase|nr:complex I NDUFA9 subunit family protein [Gemmatimonadaceae bacterium]